MKYFRVILSIKACLLLLSFYACKKSISDRQHPGNSLMSIATITPDSATYGTQVIISGTLFDALPVNNIVKFNGIKAIVQTASEDTLIVTVPKGARTGAVTVTVNGSTATGPLFNYIKTITVITFTGSGVPGLIDGADTTSEFSGPWGLAADRQGNIYVADGGNDCIRKITETGVVSTLANSSSPGFSDLNPINQPAVLVLPLQIAADANGNVFVTTLSHQRILKITPAGVGSIFAGNDTASYKDGQATQAQFYRPEGIAVDSENSVYLADNGNNRIRKITASGMVTTFAGNGISGYADGPANTAQFSALLGMGIDAQGNLYVSDDNRIRKITPAGMVSTLAGSSKKSYADGLDTTALFSTPAGLAVDFQGNIYVSDPGNERIRQITTAGVVSTLAGNGIPGFANGLPANAQFNHPIGLTLDPQGNVYIADGNNNRIRKIIIE